MRLPTHRTPATPGEILKELFLEPMELTQVQLAEHLGWTPAKVNDIINGRRGITPETALALADAFQTSPDVWLNAQRDLDLWKASQKHKKRPPLQAS